MGIPIDANPNDRDWPKRTWDLHGIYTVEALRAELRFMGMTVEQFKALPIFRFNVDRLPWLREL